MQGIKVSLSFAAFGFVLSLLFGFTSHAAFLILLLRAFIIALVFAGLGFVLFILADKFLMEDSDSVEISESSPSVSSPVGSKVDLYIRDQELDSDDGGNTYFVDDSSHQMLNNSDLRSTGFAARVPEPASVAGMESPESVGNAPDAADAMAKANAGALEGVANMPTAAPAQPEIVLDGGVSNGAGASDNGGAAASSQSNDSGLDTLPDMSGFVMDTASSSEEGEESMESEGSYTTTVATGSSDGSEYGVKDAEVMAKAISSVLSREEG